MHCSNLRFWAEVSLQCTRKIARSLTAGELAKKQANRLFLPRYFQQHSYPELLLKVSFCLLPRPLGKDALTWEDRSG